MYEYFMHSTFALGAIIESGNLDEAFTRDDYDEKIPKGIYCHYIWDGLPIVYPDMKWVYINCIFVIDTSISKRNEMYICNSVQYGACLQHPEDRIMHSKGNLKHKPDFNPLQKKIVDELYENVKQKKIKRTNKDTNIYIFSHEVIFKGKIPLTFVKAILIPKITYKKLGNKIQRLDEYLKKKNLSIKLIPFAPYTKNFHKYFEMI